VRGQAVRRRISRMDFDWMAGTWLLVPEWKRERGFKTQEQDAGLMKEKIVWGKNGRGKDVKSLSDFGWRMEKIQNVMYKGGKVTIKRE